MGQNALNPEFFTGPVITRDPRRITDITRGTTNVILLGEKVVPFEWYDPTGGWALTGGGDARPLYTGLTNTVARTTAYQPVRDASHFDLPHSYISMFGSAHRSGFNVALADGSVRHVRYAVDLAAFRPFGDIHAADVGGGLD